MKRMNRVLSLLLTAAMLFGLLPAITQPVEAANAGSAIEVLLGVGKIGNSGYEADDIFYNFVNGTQGFSNSAWGGDHSVSGNTVQMGTPGDGYTFTVNINDNELLKTLAKSSTSEYRVWGWVKGTGDKLHVGKVHDDNDRARIKVNGTTYAESKKCDGQDKTKVDYDTGWLSMSGRSTITIRAENEHWCEGWDGYSDNCKGDSYIEIHFAIRDNTCPTLSSYTTSTNATVNPNNRRELLMKLGVKGNGDDPDTRYYDFSSYNTDAAAKASREYVDMKFSFSKPMAMTPWTNGSLASVGDAEYEKLANHTLFTNTLGTGYAGQGEQRGLVLQQSKSDMQAFVSDITYRYTATYGDFSGNNPIANGGNIERGANNLLSKIAAAGFHDAAGNPLTEITGSKGRNIFDAGDGGYNVIVDAVPPTYTRTGNGITPDILTQLVINKNDKVDFIVSFSEAVITRRDFNKYQTYLMLDNGRKAYYQSMSSDGKQWRFRYTIRDGDAWEASLLKVIALGNDALDGRLNDASGKQSRKNDSKYTFSVDGRTITDYVGNVMADRANEDATTNTHQIQSSTGWAGLMVDNTKPTIGDPSYSEYGSLRKATDSVWGQGATIYVSASDKALPVAKYDPDYDANNNSSRPSKGIYRPDNTTGGTASAVGLIFYVWTRSETAPSTGENFEAIKRFSLTGEQPRTVTARPYATAWAWDGASLANYIGNLQMANNYSNIEPPGEALTDAGDGAWYLHIWTADMTWDSARQLMQYDKAKKLQYNENDKTPQSGDLYDEAAFLALKQEEIEVERRGNAPSYSTAWENVQKGYTNKSKQQVKGYYATVYSSDFKNWLNESGKGYYSDEALDYAMTQAESNLPTIYNNGYDDDSMKDTALDAATLSYKTGVIKTYIDAKAAEATNEAWDKVKDSVYENSFKEGFQNWLDEGSNDDTLSGTSTADNITSLATTYVTNRGRFAAKTDGGYYDAASVAAKYDELYKAKYTDLHVAEYDARYNSELVTRKQAYLDEHYTNYNDLYESEQAAAQTEAENAVKDAAQAAVEAALADEAAKYARAAQYVEVYDSDFLCLLTGTTRQGDQIITDEMTDGEIALANNNLKTALMTTLQGDNSDAFFIDDKMNETIAAAVPDAFMSGKTASTTAALITSEVKAYVTANTPGYNEGWEEKKAEIYTAVYTSAYIALLDASGLSRYSAGAAEYAREKMVESKVYASGYTAESAQALKTTMIAAYTTEFTTKPAKTDASQIPSYDQAWENVQEHVYETAYTARFIEWLDAAPGGDRYSDAAMLYAKAQAMLTLTQYENTSVWPLVDYTHDDSNWTSATRRLLLDNTDPTVTFGNPIGDGTKYVKLDVELSDNLSGLDTANTAYMWVRKGSEPGDAWVSVTPSGTDFASFPINGVAHGKQKATFTVDTTQVSEDGAYFLYIKCSDRAGNTAVIHRSAAVTLNQNYGVTFAFAPKAAMDGFVKDNFHPIIETKDVTGDNLYYLISQSATPPSTTDTTGYTKLKADKADKILASGTPLTEGFQYRYTLPDLDTAAGGTAEGVWYVHVIAYTSETAGTGDANFYSCQAYRLDRHGPEVTITPDGFPNFAQDEVEVVLNNKDLLSGLSLVWYRIDTTNVHMENPENQNNQSAWIKLTEEELPFARLMLKADLKANYYLHVYAKDESGNVTYQVSSSAFNLNKTEKMTTLPAYGCEILTVADGYGIANLTLAAEDKAGYRYSVSTDSGTTWCNWLPYMSMIRMKLPADYQTEGRLKVKFLAPDGALGEAKNISVTSADAPIWATAEFDSTLKRKSGKTLTFLMTLGEGVTALTPDGATKLDNGNYTVTANGVYEFELTKGEVTAESKFVVVVDIFDDVAPSAFVAYSDRGVTNAPVLASLQSGEPIRVTALKVKYAGEEDFSNVTPAQKFSFRKNGEAVFSIIDEAGNTADVHAFVDNIDTTAPNVTINTDYVKYKTVGQDDSLIASGATLTVDKETSTDEDFFVLNNDRLPSIEAARNGSYEFVVQDKAGNVTGAAKKVENIVKEMPGYTIAYNYVTTAADGSESVGDPVGDSWVQGKVKATITFDPMTDGRTLYSGSTVINDERVTVVWNDSAAKFERKIETVTNALQKTDGRFTYSRIYSGNGDATLVFCDDLDNVLRVPITIKGIDNTPPALTLNKPTVVISNDQTKRLPELSDAEKDMLLGGYTITDNVFDSGFTVTVERSDDIGKADENKGLLNVSGKYTLVYTVSDPAGNTSRTEQTLIVIPSDGLLVEAGDRYGNHYALLSGSSANNAILPDNHVKFRINAERMQAMFYDNYGAHDQSKKVYNTSMLYDVFYVPGLYREGQLKTIATRLTSEQLIGQNFEVTFPKPGWYTIIIRNQERTREFTTFFISSTSD